MSAVQSFSLSRARTLFVVSFNKVHFQLFVCSILLFLPSIYLGLQVPEELLKWIQKYAFVTLVASVGRSVLSNVFLNKSISHCQRNEDSHNSNNANNNDNNNTNTNTNNTIKHYEN